MVGPKKKKQANKQTKRKEKKNKIVQVSNFKQVPVPTPTFHSLSVTHNFYFSADWFVYAYGVSSSQKYQHLHRTRKQSSKKR